MREHNAIVDGIKVRVLFQEQVATAVPIHLAVYVVNRDIRYQSALKRKKIDPLQ